MSKSTHKKAKVPQPNGRTISVRELIMRGLSFGRPMRRNIWRQNFTGMPWGRYLELEQDVARMGKGGQA